MDFDITDSARASHTPGIRQARVLLDNRDESRIPSWLYFRENEILIDDAVDELGEFENFTIRSVERK